MYAHVMILSVVLVTVSDTTQTRWGDQSLVIVLKANSPYCRDQMEIVAVSEMSW